MQFFNFQWRISRREQEVPIKETNTQVWYKPQSDLQQTRFQPPPGEWGGIFFFLRMHTQKCPKTCNFALKLQTRKMINPLTRMQKIIKLGAYTDSEILREYPDLKNNHRPKRNLNQRSQKLSKQRVSRFNSADRARAKEGLAVWPCRQREGYMNYTESSRFSCAENASIKNTRSV